MDGVFRGCIRKAIEETRAFQKRAASRTEDGAGMDEIWIPPHFSDHERGIVWTSLAALESANRFGLEWRKRDKDLLNQISDRVAASWAIDAFGEVLCGEMSGDTDLTSEVVDGWCNEVLGLLRNRFKDRKSGETHYFPCAIFPEGGPLTSFAIGPVSFYQRDIWLDYVEMAANNDPYSARVIQGIRAGLLLPAPPVPDGSGSVVHNDIASALRYIGECRWVAGITLQGGDNARSTERAHGAVRLAIDAIGVIFRKGIWAGMRGPAGERHEHMPIDISQGDDGRLTVPSWFNVQRENGFWAEREFTEKAGVYCDIVGRAIDAVLDISSEHEYSLRQRWCDALFWFGEARRDSVGFMALAHYGVALDVLVGRNGKARGICNLATALFGLPADHQPNPLDPEMTLKKSIDIIYNECRSQLTHGGRAGLLRDLPMDLFTADTLVRRVLEEYIIQVDHYIAVRGSGEHDQRAFIDWLRCSPKLQHNQGSGAPLP